MRRSQAKEVRPPNLKDVYILYYKDVKCLSTCIEILVRRGCLGVSLYHPIHPMFLFESADESPDAGS